MKLLIFDANSIINRAFYGIRPLSNKDHVPTNAIYGFFNILLKFQEEYKPDQIIAAFDLKGPTFRHEKYKEYKGTRKPMPQELALQFPYVKKLLTALAIPVLEKPGFEADDILGTLAAFYGKKGDQAFLVTGDQDSLQLISDSTTVLLCGTKEKRPITTEYTPALFLENYGFSPKGIIDLKALMGDSSDNIPGVLGIGKKTAQTLIQKYNTLAAVYEQIDTIEVTPSVREKLRVGRENAFLSYDLATICCEAPLSLPLSFLEKDEETLYETLSYLELNTLITKLGLEAPVKDDGFGQLSLLDSQEGPTLSLEEITNLSSSYTQELLEQESLIFLLEEEGISFLKGEVASFVSSATPGYLSFLTTLMESPLKKQTHNVKRAMLLLLQQNIHGKEFSFDTYTAAYVLDPAPAAYPLSDLISRFCPTPLAQGEGRAILGLAAILPIMKNMLLENNQLSLYETIELPLSLVLAKMEHRGFLVDKAALQEFGKTLETEIAQRKEEIFSLAQEEFNINSTKQLAHILFEKLGLPILKKTKTGPSTDADVLNKLAAYHEIIPSILEYRQLAKLHSTYVTGLLAVICPETGRIHSSFNQTVTITGRISSTEPNLQNIPIRREQGREIRKMFVAPAGWTLIDADYSQIELRVLAHMSNDPIMIKAFLEGADIHTITASQVFGVPPSEVTSTMRSRAKTVNFGIIYGQGDFSLGQELKIPRKQAKAYIESYFETYHGVREYMDQSISKAKETGFVSTLLGRRRQVSELSSHNANTRAFGQRVAMNTPIQGTAADIIKAAMVRVENRLEQEGLAARLILQVHDELIVEAPLEEASKVQSIVTEEMALAFDLKVPLVADSGVGPSWFFAKG